MTLTFQSASAGEELWTADILVVRDTFEEVQFELF